MSAAVRLPWLLFAAAVERLRRVPGVRDLGPSVRWLPGILLGAAFVAVALWAVAVSPERISLADLAAGKLARSQSWIIVAGDLADEPGSTDLVHMYRLTDPAAPFASLVVRSPVVRALERTMVSGHLEGGHGGVPAGFAWSATLDADATLAKEQPPPWPAVVLAGLGLLLLLARRSRYPMFSSDTPGAADPATRPIAVVAASDSGALGHSAIQARLAFANSAPGVAELTIGGGQPMPVRLHSAFSAVDVGVLHRLGGSVPALRVKSANDDLTLAFASARERDSAFAALSEEARRILEARGLGRATQTRGSG